MHQQSILLFMGKSLSVELGGSGEGLGTYKGLNGSFGVSVDDIFEEVNVAGFIVVDDYNIEVSWESLGVGVDLSNSEALELLGSLSSCLLSACNQ
jgi:hypothetical protein